MRPIKTANFRSPVQAILFATGWIVAGTSSPALETTTELKRLSLEELLEVEVTSPGRKAESWFSAPVSLEVLTQDDIRRYGSLTLQDSFRIIPGMHVARTTGNNYSITTRGFSSTVANKMQVLMDGRSLYTPLFSGVFWDVQDTFLPDVERIEVIRGPGATLWGANAVNGVINITTKSAKDTQGTSIFGGGGNEEIGFGGVRYGARAGESTYWRVYSQYRYRDQQLFSNGADAQDFTEQWQSGFRTDTDFRDVHHFTVQGDFYLNDSGSFQRDDVNNLGGNVLGRWTRQFSERSDLQIQLYYDHSHRDVPRQYEEQRDTVDFDLQHRFQLGERHDLVWGGNYRVSADKTGADGIFSFDPTERTVQLLTGFIQDEITIIPDHLSLTLGTKLERNDFTGFEIQPSARFALTLTTNQLIWGAVSRAVRTPTRIESDLQLRPAPGSPVLTLIGNPDFESEDLIAYELGYRTRLHPKITLDFSGFYNVYDDLRTLEPTTTQVGIPFMFMNEREGETYGFEASARFELTERWRLTAGYTLILEDLDFKPGSRDPTGGSTETNDPEQMARLRSSIDLPFNLEFDQTLRFVDQLPNPPVPSYLELDLRLAWRPRPGFELSIMGMNLLDSAHPEFGGGTPLRTEVQRSVYGRILWMF